ncbi:MAG TPA: hypothetical protein VH518_19460 [Tepidisphaeraceae bacterium]|jgi:hypothetical protein
MAMWIIRGTDARSGEDLAMVVEARSKAAAECWAVKRGVPAVFITQADQDEISIAKRENRLWTSSPKPKYVCFGRPLATRQVACIMAVGIMTAGIVFARTTRPGSPAKHSAPAATHSVK